LICRTGYSDAVLLIAEPQHLWRVVGEILTALRARGLAEPFRRLDDAFHESATSFYEVSGAVRGVLRELRRDGIDRQIDMVDQVEACVRYIDFVWEDPNWPET
jgi:hypothetical protein